MIQYSLRQRLGSVDGVESRLQLLQLPEPQFPLSVKWGKCWVDVTLTGEMESGVRLGPRGCPGEQGRTMGWQTWVQIPPAFRPVDLKQVTAPESPLPQLHRRIPGTEEPSHSLNYSQDARNHHLCPSCYPTARAISRPLPPLLARTLVWQTELAAQTSILPVLSSLKFTHFPRPQATSDSTLGFIGSLLMALTLWRPPSSLGFSNRKFSHRASPLSYPRTFAPTIPAAYNLFPASPGGGAGLPGVNRPPHLNLKQILVIHAHKAAALTDKVQV